MTDIDLDAIVAKAQRGIELFPDHDPHRISGISAGDALDLIAEVERLRAENADLWLVADGWGVDDPSRESFEAWKRTHPGE